MADDKDREDPEDQVEEDDPEAEEDDPEDPDAADDDGADGEPDGEDADEDGPDKAAKDDDDEGEEEPPARKPRASDTIRQLRERAQAAERERDEATRRAEGKTAAERAAEEAAENAKVAAMPEEHRVQYLMAREVKKTQDAVRNLEVSQFDAGDKARFDAKASVNKTYAKYADDVEKGYQGLRKSGTVVPREDVLAYIIGKKFLTEGPRAAETQRRRAKKRIDAERGRPGAPRGDVGRTARRGGSLADRMDRDDPAI